MLLNDLTLTFTCLQTDVSSFSADVLLSRYATVSIITLTPPVGMESIAISVSV